MCSPSRSRPSRLVARIRTPGATRSTRSTSRATASIRCSQLSIDPQQLAIAQRLGDALLEGRADALLHRERGRDDAEHRFGLTGGASSDTHAPSRNSGSRSAASCSARRVLPTPPTPVSVTSRCSASALPTRFSSASRPTNVASCDGRFVGRASSERSGGKSSARPSATTWCTRSGRERSRRRCSPRSRNVIERSSRSTAAAASETRIWPP